VRVSRPDHRPWPATARRRSPARRAALALVWFAAAALYAATALWTPVALWPDAGHDDGFFLASAGHLLDGEWLGDYDQYTLMKGPGYGVFLWLAGWTGLPVTLATALLRAAAAAGFALAVARAAAAPALATPLFLLTLWNPISLTGSLLRVVRDTIYAEQLLLVLAGAALACFAPGPRARLLAGAAGGLVLGWFALTREEGIWVVPALALLALGAALRERGGPRAKLGAVAAPATALATACLAVQGAFALVTRIEYDAFVGVDFKAPEFRRALAALYAAGNAAPVPFVPVPRALRTRLAEVSPAFATLAPGLDPPSGPIWQWGCRFYPSTCGDIAGGWFQWALRDAVAGRGHYASPRAAEAFYARLAGEVEAACRSGELRCARSLLPYVPRPSAAQLRAAGERLGDFWRWIAYRTPPALDADLGAGRPERLEWAARLLHRPLAAPAAPPALEVIVSHAGRARGALGAELVSDGASAPIALRRMRRGGEAGGERERTRFRLVVRGELDDVVTFRSDDGGSAALRVSDLLRAARTIRVGGRRVAIERVADLEHPIRTDPRALGFRRLRAALVSLHAAFVAPLVLAGALAFVVALARALRARELPPALVLAAAVWLLLASRAAVVLAFDLAAFPAVHPLYLTPAYQMAVVAPVLSLAALCARRESPDRLRFAASGGR
jgi:hypothetical protein